MKMEDPGPCKSEDWVIFLVRLSSRDLDTIVLEDRQGGDPAAGKQDDISFSLIASAYASVLAAM
jgi:hypothetical protein